MAEKTECMIAVERKIEIVRCIGEQLMVKMLLQSDCSCNTKCSYRLTVAVTQNVATD